MGVAVGGDNFEDSVVQLENRDVEGAAAKVVDGDDAVLFFVEAVGERRRGGFVHQAQDFETGNAAGIFRGLTLRVVEVGGNGDDCFRHRAAEESLRVALELAKNKRGDFWRSESFIAQLDAEYFSGLQVFGETEWKELQLFLNVFHAASHQAFDRVDGSFRRFDQGIARGIADDRLVVRVQSDYRRKQIQAIVARNYDRHIPLHEGHQGIGGTEVDADDAIGCHL